MNKIVINILIISSLLSIQLLAKAKGNYYDCYYEGIKDTYYLNSNSRTYLEYQNIDSDDVIAGATTVGYDYLIGNGNVKPFIGAMLGFSSYTLDDHSVDLADAIYGAQAGVNYTLDKKVSLDARYKFIKSSMNESIVLSNTPINLKLDNISNLYFGINYNF